MISIAQTILDKYEHPVPTPPEAPKPKAAKAAKVPRPPVSEATLKNKAALKNALHVGTWMVEFTKVDGTPSVMECTLDSTLIPPKPAPDLNALLSAKTQPAEHLLHVYATDRQGWRSFVVDNVTKIYKAKV